MNELELIPIGFWQEGETPQPRSRLPHPLDHVDPAWDIHERHRVASYLREAKVVASYRGMSSCRICGCRNGSQEHSDGTYLWPSGFSHYLLLHDVKPPQEFIDHVLARALVKAEKKS